ALQHARQYFAIDFPMVRPVLPRRSDKNLTSPARLNVEGNRIAGHRVRALQITEFHQLVPQKSSISVSDKQMTFSFFDLNLRRELGRKGSGCVHDDFCGDLRIISHTHSSPSQRCNRVTEMKLRSPLLRALDEEARSARWIQHSVLRHEQTSSEAGPQVWFKALQSLRVQHFRRNISLAVVMAFAPDFRHLFFIGRNPNGATLLVLDIGWQLGAQSLPELLRITRQCKLRLGVIHGDNVAHASRGRTASDQVTVHDRDAHSPTREFVRASRAHYSGAHDGHVISSLA